MKQQHLRHSCHRRRRPPRPRQQHHCWPCRWPPSRPVDDVSAPENNSIKRKTRGKEKYKQRHEKLNTGMAECLRVGLQPDSDTIAHASGSSRGNSSTSPFPPKHGVRQHRRFLTTRRDDVDTYWGTNTNAKSKGRMEAATIHIHRYFTTTRFSRQPSLTKARQADRRTDRRVAGFQRKQVLPLFTSLVPNSSSSSLSSSSITSPERCLSLHS